MTVIYENKRKRTEVTVRLLERIIDNFDEMAIVISLLQGESKELKEENLNRVLKMGNWFDMVAALAGSKAADRDLLDALGITDHMFRFMKLVEKHMSDVTAGKC